MFGGIFYAGVKEKRGWVIWSHLALVGFWISGGSTHIWGCKYVYKQGKRMTFQSIRRHTMSSVPAYTDDAPE